MANYYNMSKNEEFVYNRILIIVGYRGRNSSFFFALSALLPEPEATMERETILHEEAAFLVVNKPARLLTQAARGIPSLETELTSLLQQLYPDTKNPFVGLPHRLDRGTSGVLLVARNERALKRFGLQFQTRKIVKEYVAVCHGRVEQEAGTWRDFVRKIPDRAIAEIVPEDHPDAKEAILHFQTLATEDDLSLLKIVLETGRMHQIRLQAAHRGHSILGDTLYGSPTPWGEVDPDGRWQQLALHAQRIEFRHPSTALAVSISAPFPEIWLQLPSHIVEGLQELK